MTSHQSTICIAHFSWPHPPRLGARAAAASRIIRSTSRVIPMCLRALGKSRGEFFNAPKPPQLMELTSFRRRCR